MYHTLLIVGALVLIIALAGCADSIDGSLTLKPTNTPTLERTQTPDSDTNSPKANRSLLDVKRARGKFKALCRRADVIIDGKVATQNTADQSSKTFSQTPRLIS